MHATSPYLRAKEIELAPVTIEFGYYLATYVLYDVQSLP